MYSRELLGMALVSADGKSVGRVKDVRDGCMYVDVPLQPDYWLSLDLIHTVSTVVGLRIQHAEIAAYQLDEPLVGASHI